MIGVEGASRRASKIWIAISLTRTGFPGIFDAADCAASGLPHESKRPESGGRYAQAHDPSLCLGGDRSLLLIPA
jgi:hypothetical protein